MTQSAIVIEVYRLESDDYSVPRGTYGWVEDDSKELVSVHWLPPRTFISSGVDKGALVRDGELAIPMWVFEKAINQ